MKGSVWRGEEKILATACGQLMFYSDEFVDYIKIDVMKLLLELDFDEVKMYFTTKQDVQKQRINHCLMALHYMACRQFWPLK